VTPTGPAASALGTVAVTVESLTAQKLAGTSPKSTDVVVANDDPVMVTVVPPATGPLGGEIAVMLGGATNVNVSLLDTVNRPEFPGDFFAWIPQATLA